MKPKTWWEKLSVFVGDTKEPAQIATGTSTPPELPQFIRDDFRSFAALAELCYRRDDDPRLVHAVLAVAAAVDDDLPPEIPAFADTVIRVSKELVALGFTPGGLVPATCTKGLPRRDEVQLQGATGHARADQHRSSPTPGPTAQNARSSRKFRTIIETSPSRPRWPDHRARGRVSVRLGHGPRSDTQGLGESDRDRGERIE